MIFVLGMIDTERILVGGALVLMVLVLVMAMIFILIAVYMCWIVVLMRFVHRSPSIVS